MSLRPGVRLALDWGQARIGVAACDAGGVLAYPVETIRATNGEAHVAQRLADLVAEYEPIEIIIGLPRHLRGVEGEAAAYARENAAWVASRWDVPVRLVDERLTTVVAASALRASGRGSRAQRDVIDQAAAVAILNHALELERNTHRPPGHVIDPGRTPHGS